MKKLLWGSLIGLTWCLLPLAVQAAIPAIQVAPLEYRDTLTGATSKLGFVDVANPTDATVMLHSSVEAFRQINLDGDLQFYHDDAVAAGITVSATDLQLSAREADRIAFTIDPQKLPKGGVYAAIFFATVPDTTAAKGNVIAQSARAGTLLILDNGGAGKKVGDISKLQLPLFQFGNELAGTIYYANTGLAPTGIAYNPTLAIRVSWWGHKTYLNGSLVMPGNTRKFAFAKPGSYLGIIPVVLTDSTTGHQTVRFVLAVTGWWRVVFGLLVVGVIVVASRRWRKK